MSVVLLHILRRCCWKTPIYHFVSKAGLLKEKVATEFLHFKFQENHLPVKWCSTVNAFFNKVTPPPFKSCQSLWVLLMIGLGQNVVE